MKFWTALKIIMLSLLGNAELSIAPATTSAAPYSIKCGLLWEEDPNSDFCYQFHDEQLDWLDARTTCKQQGGDLISIASREEQFYIAGQIKRMSSLGFWLGANDRSSEGGWRWTDGSPFKFLNWGAGEPNDYKNKEDCAIVYGNTAKWNDYGCNDRNGYICKKLGKTNATTPPSTTMHIPAGMSLGCPNYWRPSGNNCYQFINRSVTWDQARTLCHRRGSYLASIMDENEENFIISQLPKAKRGGYWIGLNDRLIQNNFQWEDGSPVTYTTWYPREPNNYKGQPEDCVVVYFNGGKWNDGKCNDPAQGMICKRPKLPVSNTQRPESVGCTNPAVGYQSHCFIFMNSQVKKWSDANADCEKNFYGTLATINDRYTQAFVANYLHNRRDMYWIGMSDTVVPRTYLWVDNSTVDFTFWHNTHTGNEVNTCVALRTSSPVGLWENQECQQTHHYICQYPRSGYTTPPSTLPTQPPACPSGWVASSYSSPMCYKAYYNDKDIGKLLWTEARDFCIGLGGDLASIHSAAENDFISAHVLGSKQGSFWIGINDRDNENGFVWSDNSPTDYTSWSSGEPNDYGDTEDCGTIMTSNFLWNDQNCFYASNFICAVKRGTTLLTTAAVPTGTTSFACGVDPEWFYFKGSCYRTSPDSGDSASLTWYDANQYCIDAGASLASIHSLEENNIILGLISKKSDFDAWIGLNQLSSPYYSWTDQSPMDFERWRRGEPNDYNGGERCVQMSSEWNDINCGIAAPFVCKKTPGKTPIKPPQPTALISGGCEINFIPVPHSNKCYKIYGKTAPLNFSQALSKCSSEGQSYTLASITSSLEQAFVNSLLKEETSNLWIGLHNQYHLQNFIWQDNSKLEYTNWAIGEPNGQSFNAKGNAKNTEDCVQMYVSTDQVGKWNDVRCQEALPYLCQSMRILNYPMQPTIGFCKNGYQSYGSSCYKIVTVPTTWSNARAMCSNDGGTLVNINDIYEDSFVYATAGSQSYWIGLSDSSAQSVDSYKWTLNWPVDYTNWGSGEPTRGPGEGCVAVTGGKWNDTLCTLQMPYICEINSVQPPPLTQAPAGHCSDSTQFISGDFCYFIDPFHSKSWPDARYACQKLGLDLASFHSAGELQMIYHKAVNMQPPNDDKTIAGSILDLWIGMNKGLSDGFTWVDKTALNYVNWANGEPSDALKSNNEECVEMYRSSGQWNDRTCFHGNGYICKGPAIVPTAVATQGPIIRQSTRQTQGPVITPKPYNPTYKPHINPPVYPTRRHHTLKPPIFSMNPYTPRRPFNPPAITYPKVQTYAPQTRKPLQQQAAPSDSSSGGLSGGAVAGIIIAVLIIAGIAIVAVVFVRRRGGIGIITGKDKSISMGFDNALYSTSQQSVNVDQTTNSLSRIPGEDGV